MKDIPTGKIRCCPLSGSDTDGVTLWDVSQAFHTPRVELCLLCQGLTSTHWPRTRGIPRTRGVPSTRGIPFRATPPARVTLKRGLNEAVTALGVPVHLQWCLSLFHCGFADPPLLLARCSEKRSLYILVLPTLAWGFPSPLQERLQFRR